MVKAHGDALMARAIWLTRSRADAWDLFQGTIEQALRADRRNVTADKLGCWLMVILNHRFLDDVRREKARACAPLTEDLLNLIAASPPDPSPCWMKIDDRELRDAVDRLPAHLRSVFTLHAEGRSYREMAERLGIPSKTIGTRLHRARLRLRALLFGSAPPS